MLVETLSISNCLEKLTWKKLSFGNLLNLLASEFFLYLRLFGKLGLVNIKKQIHIYRSNKYILKSIHLNLYFIYTFKFIFHPYILNLYALFIRSPHLCKICPSIWAGRQLPAMILQRIIMQQQLICRREQQQNLASRPGIPSHGERGQIRARALCFPTCKNLASPILNCWRRNFLLFAKKNKDSKSFFQTIGDIHVPNTIFLYLV